ncbi:MAG TPA: carboxypeptidase-like regulatory domain-containing protein [Candidatus Baltobacteraceae bacterium]|nr:carboxypeptidase-like regulatory domain-containing protein [Candidatus Baltobacteraceae bacterium]
MKQIALALSIALAVAAPGLAGTTGVMNGFVHDERGKPAKGAVVIAASPSDTQRTYTDKHGFFSFASLPPDLYTVEVLKAGTSNAYARGARINSDQTTFLDVHFNTFRRCPTWVQATIAADQRSGQFTSIDLRHTEAYPPNTAPPIRLPAAPPREYGMCL